MHYYVCTPYYIPIYIDKYIVVIFITCISALLQRARGFVTRKKFVMEMGQIS